MVFLATGIAIFLARFGFGGSVSGICISTRMMVGVMVGSDTGVSVLTGSTMASIFVFKRNQKRKQEKSKVGGVNNRVSRLAQTVRNIYVPNT